MTTFKNTNKRANKGEDKMKYFIHIKRNNNTTGFKAEYQELADILNMAGKNIYFGFGKAEYQEGLTYADICLNQGCNPVGEQGGIIYLYAYNADDNGIVYHDITTWEEYMFNSKMAAIFGDEYADKAIELKKELSQLHCENSCLEEVVYNDYSDVYEVMHAEYTTMEEAVNILNMFATTSGLYNDKAFAWDFTDDEWTVLVRYLSIDKESYKVFSNKTGLVIERNKIKQIKDWVHRRI